MKRHELRAMIREELLQALSEIDTKAMPAGASWASKNGRSHSAKNPSGVANHWYGKDKEKNKKSAEDWAVTPTPPSKSSTT